MHRLVRIKHILQPQLEKHPLSECNSKMAPKVVLITGCSTGIGLATAVYLAKEKQQGFKVYATLRNLVSSAKLEIAAGDTLDKTLFIRKLDVTKEDTISSVVDEILRENGRIDVLVNNAGYSGIDGNDRNPLPWCMAMMDTNYWGVVRTTRAVLPAMKKQKSGRILNVTSVSGIIGTPFYATYTSSKFAVEGFSEAIAPVLRDGYNIRVSIIEPGPVKTNLMDVVMGDPEGDAKDFDDITRQLFLGQVKQMQPIVDVVVQIPKDIAKLLQEVILSEDPHLRYQTSEAMTKMVAGKLADPTTDALLNVLKQ
ncbi:retinol dehydrogenase 8-like [Acanthaster planci]|uniref:Retinol dehydrogenase 8-like n=1 Tax=Acanthaster planci TaxID=133434 RepID=A0A8B7XVW6_ACAPL|nr:retinol dehydrogenase 8-like [Acanthaster planci]